MGPGEGAVPLHQPPGAAASSSTDKASGIVNDANDWAVETMNNPRYPLELFLRVITISLETMKIVRSLPPLDILDS